MQDMQGILEAAQRYQNDPAALDKLYLAGQLGASQTPLSAVARFEQTSAPLSVAHQDQFPAATISFDLAPGAALGDAVDAITKAGLALPEKTA